MRAPSFSEIGQRIKDLREKKGVSQKDLAKVLQVSRPVVTKIESGKKAITSVELRIIADYLGTTTDILTEPVQEENLIARFRATGSEEDPEFLGAVNKIENLIREIIGQLKLRRVQDGQNW
ncbi:hypothetical protein E308F_17000 [Moorella sp. E308F]|uniref:helix-turn-helix domain-containing protein n=1 Tax=unclassified Neomoorella TaxID=2676739 RepID=UPI0010FFB4B5|nr:MULTISPECIES: helix-turn-helix transcriptional regulator [unclassified Moorella (in: firmicutes)]GEA15456.1 hypothetical protein E308F_17000 [Moorella sp. E308F]GEA19686.1 hypothetical protein E306M_28240 [Moorella sp. E306M]